MGKARIWHCWSEKEALCQFKTFDTTFCEREFLKRIAVKIYKLVKLWFFPYRVKKLGDKWNKFIVRFAPVNFGASSSKVCQHILVRLIKITDLPAKFCLQIIKTFLYNKKPCANGTHQRIIIFLKRHKQTVVTKSRPGCNEMSFIRNDLIWLFP